MSSRTLRDHPNVIERMEYLCGSHLPDSMHEWVVRDTAGPGHNRRYYVRGMLMFSPIVVVILLVPTAWWIKVAMIALVVLPAFFFLSALKGVYLRHLMMDNDVDPDTQTGKWRAERVRRAQVYASKFRNGPRKYA
ncbi:DUF5313 family protein [Tsukamurella sp. 8F]|uniref:DUF5313 family protein n=1 Tax=unclassified Tsukamurella TaxID=2633480 RepID=UPI0023B9F9D1|nr:MULTISPECIES: DUF5313 family protein [unclassified Tsukamurella]MDF0531968.1 DUF5313 family protein [Tsukamurella sp. 8J]MDF0588867.1 DUF5313 family protein [Tsukamurella sp. 8F]